MPLFGSYFQMGDIIMIKKRGFTLLEITIVLGIGSLIGFYEVSGHEERTGSSNGTGGRLSNETGWRSS